MKYSVLSMSFALSALFSKTTLAENVNVQCGWCRSTAELDQNPWPNWVGISSQVLLSKMIVDFARQDEDGNWGNGLAVK